MELILFVSILLFLLCINAEGVRCNFGGWGYTLVLPTKGPYPYRSELVAMELYDDLPKEFMPSSMGVS